EIAGTIENSIIGRSVKIHKGAVVKNSVVLAHSEIGEGVYVENQVVDKWARIIHTDKVVSEPDKPGYIEREDTI
ncbi:MAG: glucose-1-phosphate adenylyltransferase subunit GlgD, partial [Blautia sp.]|nr:glucose-1-phosphate adenylyltransferase subunit GlgD [Blautia sp.]